MARHFTCDRCNKSIDTEAPVWEVQMQAYNKHPKISPVRMMSPSHDLCDGCYPLLDQVIVDFFKGGK